MKLCSDCFDDIAVSDTGLCSLCQYAADGHFLTYDSDSTPGQPTEGEDVREVSGNVL